jgi:hypothetical protein
VEVDDWQAPWAIFRTRLNISILPFVLNGKCFLGTILRLLKEANDLTPFSKVTDIVARFRPSCSSLSNCDAV